MAPITKSIEIQIVSLTDGNSEDAGSNPSHVRQSLLLETCQNLTKTCQNKENYDRSRRKKFFFWLLLSAFDFWPNGRRNQTQKLYNQLQRLRSDKMTAGC